MNKFEILVLRSLIILLRCAVGIKAGNNAVDLIEDIQQELLN